MSTELIIVFIAGATFGLVVVTLMVLPEIDKWRNLYRKHNLELIYRRRMMNTFNTPFDERIAQYNNDDLLKTHEITCRNISYYNAAEGNQYNENTRNMLVKCRAELDMIRKELDKRELEYSEAGYLL